MADIHATIEDPQFENLKGRRVRVTRSLTYEGEGEALLRHLAQAKNVGIHNVHPVKLTIAQGEFLVLDEPDLNSGDSNG